LKMRPLIRRLGDSRGQNLVEFSLCVFLLVMLLIGVVEIGRMVLVYTTIANAARAGERYAIVHGKDNSATAVQVKSVVTNFLSTAPMTTGNAVVHVCYAAIPGSDSCSADSGSGAAAAVGSEVTVQVSYPYDPFTSYFPLSITLGSTSQGVIAF
jgi:Flp pilus assembly protein TadG